MSSGGNERMKRALEYAARGWHVFPLAPGTKKPFEDTRGFYNATTDPETIRRWWTKSPDANIGIRTGKTSGIFVVDADASDGKHGIATLRELEKRHGKLPETRTVQTARQGRHLYFQLPVGKTISCSAGRLGPDIEVKGEGGYVAAPPSTFEGGTYKVLNSASPTPAPDWLVDLLGGYRDTEDTEDTDAVSPSLSSLSSPSLCLSVSSIGEAVSLSLPNGVHQSNRRLFDLARALKAFEAKNGILTPEQVIGAFDDWYEQTKANSFLRPDQTRDEYLSEFLHGYRNVRVPLGADGHLEKAWKLAQSEPMPPEAEVFKGTEAKLIVALCFQLSRLAEGRAWYLPGRAGARVTGQPHQTVARTLSALIALEILEIVEVNTTTRATRYRYKPSKSA